MTKPSIGFADLAKIKPEPVSDTHIPNELVDRAGEKAGFVSREPMQRLSKHPTNKEPVVNLNMRPPISLSNRFVAFSKQERMTYNEALAYLLDLAEVDDEGVMRKRRER